MCIVSIYSHSDNEIILTQNRDESILRPTAENIQTKQIHEKLYTGPVDLVSGGTWMYHSEDYLVCLLNGGYQKHKHQPPYRMSRGILVLELLRYRFIDKFTKEVKLHGIEPFTMIMISRKSNEKKILVWDGNQKSIEDVSEQNLVVRSSSTLYSDEEKTHHKKYFENLKGDYNPKKIKKIHHQLKMLKNNKFPTVQTTSITQITQSKDLVKLKFCPIKT
ncbi:MAG: NRDE family protein [Moheibacter sp.]